MSLRLVSAALALGLLACSSVSPRRYRSAPKSIALEQGAEMVELVSFVSDDRLMGFDEVGTIECRLGMNYSEARANVEACENYLRNEALAQDASIAWVKPEWKRVGTGRGCENCVEMRALLLTPKVAGRRSATRRP